MRSMRSPPPRRSARALRLGTGAAAMAADVNALRNSIVRIENGEAVTYPFDLERARALYLALFGPVDAEVRGLNHLIFEPDGAMLRLPPNLLPGRQAGVDAYRARPPGRAPIRSISPASTGSAATAKFRSRSARAFRDVRAIAPSRARQAYLGFGENAVALTRPMAAVADECDWPLAIWQDPISADGAQVAEARFGPAESRLVTGAAFTDTAMLQPMTTSTIIASSISPPTAWSPRRGPNARRGRRC